MRQKSMTERRTKSPEQALAALMRLCARAEKSTGDARRLMRGWGVDERAQEAVIRKLIEQRFIDDVRFAEAFVREKINLSGWGAYKIRATLLRKGIERMTIERILAEIDPAQNYERLHQLLTRKMRSIRAATQYELKTKLIRYGMSAGFEFETVADVVGELINKEEEECDIF